MQPSHRSPRQPGSRSRLKPYTRRQPQQARAGSIMSTIKNIFTAPLAWLATNDEFEDSPGKRRRAALQHESRMSKKQRIRSPSPNQGYLDPPQVLFQPSTKHDSRLQPTTAFSPSLSINIPAKNIRPQAAQHFGPHIYSPNPTRSYSHHDITRTMPTDSPVIQTLVTDATMVPLPHSREQSIASISRENSTAPTRTSFRMRTTLSPIPTGAEFGPKPRRKEQDPSEPPPLTALMSNPIFVKPPPDAHPMQRSLSAQPTTTLGGLTQTHRQTRSPLRHSSGLLFGSQEHLSGNDSSLSPINASEIALSELAVYRTPLLPTRLRGSSAIPDMFKPKKVHQVVPMRKGKGDMPRLGSGEKKKAVDDSSKPYSGRMKKLLTRRKFEAEEEKKQEQAEEMVDDGEPNISEVSEKSRNVGIPVAVPAQEPPVQQHRVSEHETSSLRVGRTRTRQPLRPSKAKFSAIYEDDDAVDQTDQMKDGDELPKPAPIFEAPKGFSFASEIAPQSSIPAQVAKEPPIPSLPFSLTKASTAENSDATTSTSLFTVSVSAPSQPVVSPSTVLPATVTPTLPATPALSQPAPPQHAKSSSPETTGEKTSANLSVPTSAIPNFFANSPLLTKAQSVPPMPAAMTLFEPFPPKKSGSEPPDTGATSLFGSRVSSTPGASLFGHSDQSSSVGTSLFSSPALTNKPDDKMTELKPPFEDGTAKSPEAPVSSASLFGGSEYKPLFGSQPAQPAVTEDVSKSLFGSVTTPSSASNGGATLSFSGLNSAKPEPIAGSVSSDNPRSPPSFFGNSVPFTFGASTTTPVTPPIQNGSTKPLFGPGLITSTSSEKETPKLPFMFGSSPSKFKFESASGTPSAEKPTSVFGDTPTSGSGFLFGSTGNNSDVSKPLFSSRPTTPPLNDQEVRMEESPIRSMDINDKPSTNEFPAARSLSFGQVGSAAPFSFGSSSTTSNAFGSKPEEKVESKAASSGFGFGASHGGFGFGQKQPEPSQPFSFGKTDSNAQQSSTSPFAFGSQKLPEINTNTGGFFGQKPPGSGQSATTFNFGQQSPATSTAQFGFGSQGTGTSTFCQQPASSAPNSPSTFNHPTLFGFSNPTTPSTAPANPFSFQPASPVANPLLNGAFSFGQSTNPQSSAPPFGTPTSPQTAGNTLFTIGAAPNNSQPGARQIKKLPTRRGLKR